ncbi:hypothetical protein NQ314_004782 [Rhamnusium bicolor]|uniref:Uncharacterized protein n=1 Tax=Rhamnusium bicolor TaxID=1586634 RepID=A0AAV8ZK43_9CUCU|nr:hypothetical protein NQ314_004782 [Rhamnusium bicolor]
MVSLKCKEIFCLIYSGLLFVSGILLITFSVILSYRVLYHYSFIPSGTIGPFIVIFILGFLHLCLTWLGIKGPPREHNFHIILFMIFTLILLICEVTVGIWSMVLWNEVSVESTELMTMSFNDKLHFNQKAWSKLQSDVSEIRTYKNYFQRQRGRAV